VTAGGVTAAAVLVDDDPTPGEIDGDPPAGDIDSDPPSDDIDEESLVAVGRRCLQVLPEGDDVDALIAAVDLGGGDPVPDEDPARLELLLAATADRIRGDFSNGATISVDGWVLSLTEARLCALIALAS
jgi:hypothetical protein